MALDKIASNGQDNAKWRSVIDAGIDALNDEILQSSSTITVTQSGNESTTQCVITGHISQTLNASDYSNSATDTIEAALALLPKNMGGHTITLKFGLDNSTGQTVTISDSVNVYNYTGGVFFLISAYSNDNDSDSSTKANKIQSAGTTIERLFSFSRCTEVYIQGLEFIQNTSTQTNSFVIACNTGWFDVNHVKLTGGGTGTGKWCLLVQRGANVLFRDSWVDNAYSGVLVQNNAKVSVTNGQYTGTKPAYGVRASNGIAIINGTQIEGSTADYYASGGGLITNKNGLILEETVLTGGKIVNFDNSMSVSDMQDLINIQPKNLNGHTLTFQFADGTYDFGTSYLLFNAFDSGKVVIKGDDQTINADGSGLDVIIQTQNTGNNGAIKITNISKSTVKNIQFIQNGSNIDSNVLEIEESSSGRIDNCSFQNTGTQGNDAIDIKENSCVQIQACYFDNFARNILALDNSKVHSQLTYTYSGGTDASQANLYCEAGSIITQTATQAGGGNSKQANTGAVIFDKDGALV